MKPLLIDAGNTRVRIARASGAGFELLHSCATVELLAGSLGALPDLGTVGEARIAAVGGVSDLLTRWVQDRLAGRALVLRSPKRGDGIVNAYGDRAADLGVDRWLAMIAAHRQGHGATLIVDAGTAMTLDLLTADGHHLGGYIVPGLSLARGSLHHGTAALPAITGDATLDLASSTSAAIANGTLAQAVALIAAVRASAAQGSKLLVTGGDAASLLPLLGADVLHAPDLVLEGLAAADPATWVH